MTAIIQIAEITTQTRIKPCRHAIAHTPSPTSRCRNIAHPPNLCLVLIEGLPPTLRHRVDGRIFLGPPGSGRRSPRLCGDVGQIELRREGIERLGDEGGRVLPDLAIEVRV